MSKYKVGQILKVLGGFEQSCMIAGEWSVGKIFEVISEKQISEYDFICGWVPQFHNEYLILKCITDGEIVCLNEDIEVDVVQPFGVGEKVEVIGKSVSNSYEIGDVVTVLRIEPSLYDRNTYMLELKREGDSYTQTLPMFDVKRIDDNNCKNILTINEENEVTYYENGNEVKTRIKDSDLQEFLNKLNLVPHLESVISGANFGTLGEPTKLKDSLDTSLFVGDIVEIYKDGIKCGNEVIIAKNEKYGAFVYGWASSINESDMKENMKFRKVKSFEELENGYQAGIITVVREEK